VVERPKWAPGDIDLERPSVARVYDYWLGGAHNFAADRVAGDKTLETMPELKGVILTNRALLRRMVRHLVESGVRQFLDLGSGIPTAGNVHEIARQVDPATRVVYVDVDPVAVAHGKSILSDTDGVIAMQADIREPESVLEDPAVREVLDFTEPIAVLMIALLHFMPDSDEPAKIINCYLEPLVPGSYLGISHYGFEDGEEGAGQREARQVYSGKVTPMVPRNRTEFACFFAGLELVDPGVTRMPLWHPESPDDVDEDAARFPGFGALARKP
jgi:hypothetical protein